MPARDFDLLQRYWLAEPWGPYRDNLHAAMITLQLMRPHLKKGVSLTIDDLMYKPADVRAEETKTKRERATRNLYGLLRSLARKRDG